MPLFGPLISLMRFRFWVMYVRVSVLALLMPMRSMTIHPEVLFMTACRSSLYLITVEFVMVSLSGSVGGMPEMEQDSQ